MANAPTPSINRLSWSPHPSPSCPDTDTDLLNAYLSGTYCASGSFVGSWDTSDLDKDLSIHGTYIPGSWENFLIAIHLPLSKSSLCITKMEFKPKEIIIF